MNSSNHPEIAILMATYNGEKYVKSQIKSFINQTYTHWKLYVSDDGSNDNTLEIIKELQTELGVDRVFIFNGPKKGFAANFLSLACNSTIHADYYAFSDQDDIWQSDKLARALDILNAAPVDLPALYCGRTAYIVDEQVVGYSAKFIKKPCFSNALVQCMAGGNTMIFNQAGCALLRETGFDVGILSHDWWSYLLMSACHGAVFYDDYPAVHYRQHGANQIGMNTTFVGKLSRFLQLMSGDYKGWNDHNCKLLTPYYEKFSADNKIIFDRFMMIKKSGLFGRIYYFFRSGVFRQTLMGNIALFIAVLFKKL